MNAKQKAELLDLIQTYSDASRATGTCYGRDGETDMEGNEEYQELEEDEAKAEKAVKNFIAKL